MKDETAYAVIKYLNGFLFCMEVGGFKGGYSDSVLQQLANKAKFHGVNEIVIEANFGDGMFTKLITPIVIRTHPCAISEVKNYTQKEARIIDTLEPVLMRHKLIMNTQVITDDYAIYEANPQYSLFYQMTRLSRDRGSLAHDDRLDVLTMAVKYWLEQMDRDESFGRDEIIERQLEQWLDPDRGVMWIEDKGDNKIGNRYNFVSKEFY
ncbi:phage terminase large subunit [uncultured Veillonella sp.]|uniref:phage terminase large subunit n=1 Tax=uncultured Veillonella sp. TaxID=159268 RepID=UPI0025FD98F3|nr:phage terminase large subunit [uncultured Veillonella sp.]